MPPNPTQIPDKAAAAPRAARPLEFYDLSHPAVPPGLEGLSILHLADLHTRRGRRPPSVARLLRLLPEHPVDLVALTGDFMDHPGDETRALEVLASLAGAWRARIGAFGIFGNHDSPAFQRQATEIPGIRWVVNDACEVATDSGSGRLVVAGASFPEDVLRAHRAVERCAPGFVLGLVHYPTELFPASELGWPLVLAGHTHGGQIRVNPRITPHTSCDLPSGLASGLLARNTTLCGISRGLGSTVLPLRLRCPPQAPIYRLHRAPAAFGGEPRLRCVIPW